MSSNRETSNVWQLRGPDGSWIGLDTRPIADVRVIGLSEVGPETIRRAQAVHPIADLQIEYSLISRAPEARIIPLLSELGIGMTAYGVLSRGLLSGSKPNAPGDFRAYLPRFTGENLEQNQRLVGALRQLATEKHATASQLAITASDGSGGRRARGRNLLHLVGEADP